MCTAEVDLTDYAHGQRRELLHAQVVGKRRETNQPERGEVEAVKAKTPERSSSKQSEGCYASSMTTTGKVIFD